MITYVDTSTLLKLLVEEEGSAQAGLIWDTAEALSSVALTIVESRAALASAARGGRLTTAERERAKADLAILVDIVNLIEVTDGIIDLAADIAEGEGLRGYDAVHLAAAITVGAEVLTSADVALCEAAARRGLHIANPLQP